MGLSISLPNENSGNQWISNDLDLKFHYFFMRKFWFIYLAKALMLLTGYAYEPTFWHIIHSFSLLGALLSGESVEQKVIKENKTQTWTFESGKATSIIGRIVRPRLDIALTEMLGPTERSRKAVIKAGELINAMFIVTFEKAKSNP